jgi:hypothetical protein
MRACLPAALELLMHAQASWPDALMSSRCAQAPDGARASLPDVLEPS